MVTLAPYGYCPTCGDAGAVRERRPNGDDTCVSGHKYPSAKAVKPTRLAAAIAQMKDDDAHAPVYGALRFCFTLNKLSAVVLLREDGSCDTPPCDWTTVRMPLRMEDMAKVRISMDVMDYHRMCGLRVRYQQGGDA